jgi:hypothetical protein
MQLELASVVVCSDCSVSVVSACTCTYSIESYVPQAATALRITVSSSVDQPLLLRDTFANGIPAAAAAAAVGVAVATAAAAGGGCGCCCTGVCMQHSICHEEYVYSSSMLV